MWSRSNRTWYHHTHDKCNEFKKAAESDPPEDHECKGLWPKPYDIQEPGTCNRGLCYHEVAWLAAGCWFGIVCTLIFMYVVAADDVPHRSSLYNALLIPRSSLHFLLFSLYRLTVFIVIPLQVLV